MHLLTLKTWMTFGSMVLYLPSVPQNISFSLKPVTSYVWNKTLDMQVRVEFERPGKWSVKRVALKISEPNFLYSQHLVMY